MKKTTNVFLVLIFVSITIFTGCKKDKPTDTTTPVAKTSKPSDQQGPSEADAAISDVSNYINNMIGGGSTKKVSTPSAYNLPCGVVSIDSSTTNSGGHKVYSMHYGSQTPCGYKKKSGYVSFAIISGTAFNAVGMTYKINFIDYVVQSLATGDTVTLNGYITVKNVNGGYIWEAVTLSSTLVYQLRGTFSVTYSDGTIRDVSYFQLYTYNSPTSDWAGLSLSIGGDTVIASANVSEIGKTYDGNYYYQTEILTNFAWSNCGTTYAGPYLLKTAHARYEITIPFITPTYVDIEGGYYWNYTNPLSTPTLIGDCTSNAYKITTVIGTGSVAEYQLY